MKAKIIICTILFALSFSVNAIGCGGDCGNESYSSCGGSEEGCGWSSYSGTPTCSDCSCTDPGWKENTCVSKSVYCRAFGNQGALEDY